MKKEFKSENLPWCIPIPIKKSNFVSLKKEGARFNFITDVAAIGSFRSKNKSITPSELLYVDQQQTTINNSPLNLGSGRAGFFQGKYVKGMGLTLLAGNWNTRDGYHNSGHLLPSAAIREYLVSCYLKKKGVGDSIVGCKGILLKPLSPELRGYTRRTFSLSKQKKINYSSRMDDHLQAITYKEGDFARASNFIWFLSRMGANTGHKSAFKVFDFLSLLFYFLNPTLKSRSALNPQPMEIVSAFETMIEGVYKHFQSHFMAGVYWGSFHNNFTLDGRFLDLEVPTVVGGPWIGGVSVKSKPSLQIKQLTLKIDGGEILDLILNLRSLTKFFENHISYLVVHKAFTAQIECEYMQEFLSHWRQTFSPRHWIYSKTKVLNRILDFQSACFDLSAKERVKVSALLKYKYDVSSRFNKSQRPYHQYTRVSASLAKPEPHMEPIYLYVDSFLKERIQPEAKEDRCLFNSLLTKVEKLTEIDAIFDALNRAEIELTKKIHPIK